MTNPGVSTATEKDIINERLVDELIAIFGSHSGCRPLHAKGIVCQGTFARLEDRMANSCTAFADVPSPVTGRFSDFSGVRSA